MDMVFISTTGGGEASFAAAGRVSGARRDSGDGATARQAASPLKVASIEDGEDDRVENPAAEVGVDRVRFGGMAPPFAKRALWSNPYRFLAGANRGLSRVAIQSA
jgi:hypothetical protein